MNCARMALASLRATVAYFVDGFVMFAAWPAPTTMKSKTAVITLLALLAIKASAQAPGPPLVLEHANVFMASQSPWLHDMTVVVSAGRIESVQTSAQRTRYPALARRIDLHGAWLLPGLIDAHVHVADIPGAHRMLALGVTTGRSMLTTGYEDVGLKALYDRGDKDVPEILAAGFPVVARPMQIKPGLSSLFLDNPDLDDIRFRDRIGIDGARRIVLDNAKRHVDWIKVFANGRAGVLSSEPTERDLNDAELTAAVQQATALGLPVAAHAYSDGGVSAAIHAGVRTIEHGSLITEPTIRLMKDKGVCFVPTLSAFYSIPPANTNSSADEKALSARGKMMIQHALGAIAIAHRLGVRIVAGTDTTYDADEPTVVDEIKHLADSGLTRAEAIESATAVSASCLGIEKRKGAIAAGLDADIVAYANEPTMDLHVLEKPILVIMRGSVYLDNLASGSQR
jgi:imidazolonepropionase-like amidohydrolase